MEWKKTEKTKRKNKERIFYVGRKRKGMQEKEKRHVEKNFEKNEKEKKVKRKKLR